MAKFTELFAEYLAGGGALPSAFENITGFTNLFKGYYADKEIGFETEDLFAIKLETYANIYIPIYKQRIEDLAEAITGAKNPAKTFYENYSTIINAGKQKGYTTDLPFDSSTAQPSSVTESDAYTNTDNKVINRTEAGATVNEAFYKIEKLNDKVKPLILELLKEFKPCFMQIY